MAKVITWNGVASSIIPELTVESFERQILGEQQGNHVKIDGREGTYYFPQSRGRRSIISKMWVLSSTFGERGDILEDVADWLDVNQEAQLILSDRPTRYWMAVLNTIPTPEEWRHLASFEIEWLVQPYSFDESISVETWTSDVDDDHIWNPGLIMDVYPVIEITPTNGTLLSLEIQANGNSLTWAGSVASGDTVTINSIAPTVVLGDSEDTMLTGAYDALAVSMAGVDGAFPILIPSGTNQVRFIKTGGTATSFSIIVSYRKKYRR